MNQTIVKIAGIVAICLGSVALFLTGIGESAVIAIVSAVFVLAGLVAALFKPKAKLGLKSGAETSWIELIAFDTRTRKTVIVGTVNDEVLKGIKAIM